MSCYVDSHAHIFSKEYSSDFENVTERIEKANIGKVLIITLDNEEAEKAMEFACKDPERYQVATGIFPEDATKATDAYWNTFEKICRDPRISVIGEIGLDYYWEKDPGVRQLQRDLFIKQIELAKSLNKPIAVHARDAMQDTYDIMKAHHHKGVLHCFSGTKEMAAEFTKLGYYIALGGALTFKNARHSVEVCTTVESKYLLTETDCPYMSPEPLRGTRNEPCNIPYILEKMAAVREVSVESMQKIVENNYERFLHGE